MHLNDVASLSSRLVKSARAGLAAGRDRRALARLPDRLLKDIGLTRGEIDGFGRQH